MDAGAPGAKHLAGGVKPIDNPLLYAATTLPVQMPRLPHGDAGKRTRMRRWRGYLRSFCV